jgi:hypothetical protein
MQPVQNTSHITQEKEPLWYWAQLLLTLLCMTLFTSILNILILNILCVMDLFMCPKPTDNDPPPLI